MALKDMPLAEWHVGPDWQIEKDDHHCLLLGRLVALLQTIETLIRLALHEDHDRSIGGKPSVALAAFHALKKGDSVELAGNEHFEDWAMLKDLVQRFNGRFPSHAVSEDLVVLRDALAHGRVMPVRDGNKLVLKLVKFAKPAKGATHLDVTVAYLLTPDWFETQKAFVLRELEKVRAAGIALSHSTK